MQRYVVSRFAHSVIVLFGVTLVTFLLVRLTGDPISAILGQDATPQEIEAMRQRLRLDDPMLLQYWRYLQDLLRGDFGDSFLYRRSSLELVIGRLPATFELAAASLLISLVFAFPLGIMSAVWRDSVADRISMIFIFVNQAMPVFWVGILGIMFFSVRLGWLPTSGRGGITYLIMPAMVLGLNSAAYQTRLLRSAMLDVLSQDFVVTARAKGLRERSVILRHATRNALIPVITASGVQFAALMSGSVITETVFAWPGVGSLALEAIRNRDIPLVIACTFVFAVIILIVNLLVDLSYGLVDSRVRIT